MEVRKNIRCAISVIALVVLSCTILGFGARQNTMESYADTSSTELYKAIQETAYSFYMRGPYIQYNSLKGNPSYFSPEEATSQNMNYLVCSAFTKNVYYDLLDGVKIPPYTESLLNYSKANVGSPEVVLYGARRSGTTYWKAYDEVTGGITELTNMTTDDFVKYLKVGDILTYTGHAMLVYELVYDDNGNVINAKILESGHGYKGYNVLSKISKTTRVGGLDFGSSNHLMYTNSRQNTSSGGRMEGSIHLSTVKGVSVWKDLATSTVKEYSVLRFLTEKDGQVILTYHGTDFSENDYNGVPIELSQKVLDRVKFSKLYIEKTVDAFMGSSVEVGDEMIYRIVVRNDSGGDYTEDILVSESLSPYVEYKTYESNKTIAPSYDLASSKIVWNIGKLMSGEEVVIEYKVAVKENSWGNTIESTGLVGNIPSAVIRNNVQHRLTVAQEGDVVAKFESLKNIYSSKKLINEIYKAAFDVDLGLEDFVITDLIKNNDLASNASASIELNDENAFYDAVLNKYWSTMAKEHYTYNGADVNAYDMKMWRAYNNINRRADTIYKENFKTGDVLIYTNQDDNMYQYVSATDSFNKVPVTNENGEYVYIYIEGKGFVGVNLGADGVAGTSDDRNSFNVAYYTDNGLRVYSDPNETDTELLDFANYQTLFGKDYYVILRPALLLDFSPETPTDDPDNPEKPDEPAEGDDEPVMPGEEGDGGDVATPDTGGRGGVKKEDGRVNFVGLVGVLVGVAIYISIYIYNRHKIRRFLAIK